MREVNTCMLTRGTMLRTVEDILARITPRRKFKIALDLKCAFWQFEVERAKTVDTVSSSPQERLFFNEINTQHQKTSERHRTRQDKHYMQHQQTSQRHRTRQTPHATLNRNFLKL